VNTARAALGPREVGAAHAAARADDRGADHLRPAVDLQPEFRSCFGVIGAEKRL
jgi:hypothetical protein